jgi:hypothetical protein
MSRKRSSRKQQSQSKPLHPGIIAAGAVIGVVFLIAVGYLIGKEMRATRAENAALEKYGYLPVGSDPGVNLPAGNVGRGDRLFNGQEPGPDGFNVGCYPCHNVNNQLGPVFDGIMERIPDGYTAEDYIRESILLPSEYLVEGYEDLHPRNYTERLDKQSFADLVAYVMSR